jgi:hypothetical protein
MAQQVLRIEGLPEEALGAAAAFHAEWLPKARELAERDDLALVFPPAPYDHRGWRLAAVQDLARAAAPKRVNGVVGDDEAATGQAVAWLAEAAGITGQLLATAPPPKDAL